MNQTTITPDSEDFHAVTAEHGTPASNAQAAVLYRLAQARKLMRLSRQKVGGNLRG